MNKCAWGNVWPPDNSPPPPSLQAWGPRRLASAKATKKYAKLSGYFFCAATCIDLSGPKMRAAWFLVKIHHNITPQFVLSFTTTANTTRFLGAGGFPGCRSHPHSQGGEGGGHQNSGLAAHQSEALHGIWKEVSDGMGGGCNPGFDSVGQNNTLRSVYLWPWDPCQAVKPQNMKMKKGGKWFRQTNEKNMKKKGKWKH